MDFPWESFHLCNGSTPQQPTKGAYRPQSTAAAVIPDERGRFQTLSLDCADMVVAVERRGGTAAAARRRLLRHWEEQQKRAANPDSMRQKNAWRRDVG